MASRASRAVFFLFPGIRSGLLSNAENILGPSSSAEDRKALALETLASFSRFLTELVAARGRGPRQDLRSHTSGREHFEEAAAIGKGVIALTLHMGNYELASLELASLRPNVAVVYNRERITFLERMRSRRRRERNLDEIVIDDSRFFAIEVLRRLREGGVILLSGDQVAARDGERFPFLHGTAPFSLWPARLSISSGAPIVPAFNVRTAAGECHLQIEPPIFPAQNEAPEQLMRKVVEVFERYVREHASQWLMIRPYWVDEPEC